MRYELVTPLEGITKSQPLHEAHWAEAGQPTLGIDPDFETYAILCDSESFGILVYDEDEVIGYAVIFVSNDTHTKMPIAYNDAIFVKPEYRTRGVGGRLILMCEQIAKERGAKSFQWACKDGLAMAKVFENRPFMQKQVVYERSL